MRSTPLSLLLSSTVLLAACGGKVLFEDDADGGNGGNSGTGGTSTNASTSPATNSTTSSTMTTNAQVSVSTTSVGGAPPFDCKSGCETLYGCGLQNGLCPGFDGSPEQQEGFLQGCVEGCLDQPALLNLINGDDCPGTIATVKGVSVDFQAFCDGAPVPPG